MKANEIRDKSLDWFYGKDKPKLSLVPESEKKHIEILYMLNKIAESK